MSEIRIVSLKKITDSVPAQWTGETASGPLVYIRYRFGALRVHVGPGIDEAIERDPVFVWDEGDEYDGCMDEEELRELLPTWIVLPEVIA